MKQIMDRIIILFIVKFAKHNMEHRVKVSRATFEEDFTKRSTW